MCKNNALNQNHKHFFLQWFDDLHIYQQLYSETVPNHELEPGDTFTNDDNLPVTILFPPNVAGEVFIRAQYDESTGEDLAFKVAEVAIPGK